MTKTKKKSIYVKLVFGLALLLFIGWKVTTTIQRNDFVSQDVGIEHWGLLAVAALLMPVNWLMESLKWHLLIRSIRNQPFKTSVADVLAGVSTSLLTPNRIGNFIGRTVGTDKEHRIVSILATIHSNLAQFIANILFGFLALMTLRIDTLVLDQLGLQITSAAVILFALFIYLFPKVLNARPLKRLYSRQMTNGIERIQNERIQLKMVVLLLSLLRYLVYLIQFYLILSVFQNELDASLILPAMALVYLIITIVPSFLFGKFLVREASAIFVLELFEVPSHITLVTVMLLWSINLAIPALGGMFVLFRRG